MACIVVVTNEGEPLHTVTIHTEGSPYSQERLFLIGTEAHQYARETINAHPPITVTVTDSQGRTVDIQSNGWSRVNA